MAAAAGRTCRNLDPYIMGWEPALSLFGQHTQDGSVALVEGNRGLFDGLDKVGSISTAELAKRLKAPVVLVVDCTKVTRTVAAMVLGCLKFDPQVRIGGVILNRLGGSRHRKMIQDCLADSVDLPILGAIPRFGRELPERHMGLVTHLEHPEAQESLAWLKKLAQDHLDLKGLLALASSAPPLELPRTSVPAQRQTGELVRLGVIQDSAFQFYYPENLEALSQAGADLIRISALDDPVLPELDGLYIGGGFPETHAGLLAENRSFRESLKQSAEKGLPIYAECGGLMVLGKSLTMEGRTFPMAGVLEMEVEVKKRPQGHGYTRVQVDRPNPFYPLGTELRGHEFHYSRVTNFSGSEENLAFRVDRGQGVAGGRDGVIGNNVLATYTHVHALGTPAWAKGLVEAARRWRARRANSL
jgi:cobyrinic acid a,c-diamide synthase